MTSLARLHDPAITLSALQDLAHVIRPAFLLYVRFPPSLRNVEDLLHKRGFDICHETVRQWWMRFGQMFAAEVRKKRASRLRAGPQWRWDLDEIFVKINGERHYLWRAVDHEGEVVEGFVTITRDEGRTENDEETDETLRCARTDDHRQLRSYGAALKVIGGTAKQVTGKHLNNRAENLHPPFRRGERAMLRFRRMRSLRKFIAVHASVCTHFNLDRSLSRRQDFKLKRDAALAGWRQLAAV